MINFNNREPIILFIGDIIVYFLSLYAAIAIRYFSWPSADILSLHLWPFSIIILLAVVVYIIVGLYDTHTVLLRKAIPQIILYAHITISILSVSLFYFIPYFGITPKTNLFIYLGLTLALIYLWRIVLFDALSIFKKEERALIAADSQLAKEIKDELASNPKYAVTPSMVIELDSMSASDVREKVSEVLNGGDISIVIIDFSNEKITQYIGDLYGYVFSRTSFVDAIGIYEELFDRIPITHLHVGWLLQHVSSRPKIVFDVLKRVMDIVLSLMLALISLPVYFLVWLAIRFDDGGVLFSVQNRVGQNGKNICLYKFRTMSIANDNADWNKVVNEVTKVGRFLRKSRIDELPQLWNVLRGDLSLIGPRPEFLEPVLLYEKEIPYYSVRHIVKPGLSGWAQIYHQKHPHHMTSVSDTQDKVSYDLYYIKNRSVILDIKIALRTIRTLISRSGA